VLVIAVIIVTLLVASVVDTTLQGVTARVSQRCTGFGLIDRAFPGIRRV